GGDDDDRDLRELRVALHLREHLVPVHLGHRQVEQHRGGLELGHLGERLAAIQGGGEQVVPCQGRLLEGQHRLAVVHEQQVRKAHAASLSQRRTAAWSSAACRGLVKSSLAPASRPFFCSSSLFSPVSRSTGTFLSASSLRNSRVNTNPSITGM